MVNDHTTDCFRYEVVGQPIARKKRPRV
jgi:hypothetical protein